MARQAFLPVALLSFALIVSWASAGNSNSICDRYSRALKVTNTQLLYAIVNGTVAGVVSPNAVTKKFFDGTKPAGSVNYLKNPVALNALKGSIVNFFWGPLGCTDMPGRKYTGQTMAAAHGSMGINDVEFDYFNSVLLGVLTKAGVTQNDVNAVKTVLESLRGAIVKSDSICDKYSKALKLTNTQLVTTVVKGTIGLLVAADAPTKKYFDGTKPSGSVNYLDSGNAQLLQALTDSLVNFFWGPLGCSMDPVRRYTGGSMQAVHAAMKINDSEFSFFRDAVGQVLTNAGAEQKDVAAVKGVIDTLRSQIVKP